MINGFDLPYVVYKDTDTRDFDLYVVEKNAYDAPSRDLEFISVAGRNGDLIVDNGRFNNLDLTYRFKIIPKSTSMSFKDCINRIKAWLFSGGFGYFRLWDTYDPNYYRLAAVTGVFETEQEKKISEIGYVTLKLNCKPFRYAVDGEKPLEMTSSGKIYNPEAFESSPYIRIDGSGSITLSINNDSFALTNVDGYIELDSDTLNAYKGAVNQNTKMSNPSFPRLLSGENTISWTGTVSKVTIIPRWRTL